MTESFDPVAEVRVAPGWILVGHSDREPANLLRLAWPSGTAPGRMVMLPGDEPSMPSQDGVCREERRYSLEHASPKGLALGGESPALVVREPRSLARNEFSQDSILLAEI